MVTLNGNGLNLPVKSYRVAIFQYLRKTSQKQRYPQIEGHLHTLLLMHLIVQDILDPVNLNILNVLRNLKH